MDSITLSKAKEISVAINAYGEKNEHTDFDKLITFVKKKTNSSQDEIVTVIQFLQEIQGATETIPINDPDAENISQRVKTFLEKPVDLHTELSYNYGVARVLLDTILERGHVPDSEEVRKTLREISRFADSMLKMQERVYNIQQMQVFQERVIALLENHVERELLVPLLMESDL
jgi:hypothetical protein